MRELDFLGELETFPNRIEPMLAQAGDKPIASTGWVFEPKLDGYRGLAYVREGRARIFTRGGLDYSNYFPHICNALAKQPVQPLILDGEIVAFENGQPSFAALQRRVNRRDAARKEDPAQCVFFAFDVLHAKGHNTRPLPYSERREILEQIVEVGRQVQLTHVHDDGQALYDAVLAMGLEGVMAKKKDAPYVPGFRSPCWKKIKPRKQARFIIIGFTRNAGGLSSLLVGYRYEGRLHYAARVSVGLSQAICRQLLQHLTPLVTECPPEHKSRAGTIWVQPKLCAEISFFELTDKQRLRLPVFVRLVGEEGPSSPTGPAELSL